jgi:predicted nucleic acid-binding protein
MEIVVDTNIIISALLKDGLTRRILLLSPFELYTIACAQEEIEAHKSELIHKSKLNDFLLRRSSPSEIVP